MSEDIVARNDHSPFFRTAPGQFFLRDFLADRSLPEEFRKPFPARRRFRDLRRGPALAIDKAALSSIAAQNTPIRPDSVYAILAGSHARYDDPKYPRKDSVFLWSFVCVNRDSAVLSYRLGRYREDRDNFRSRRSIGFSTLVDFDEHTLFNIEDYEILDAGVRATEVDLDIPKIPKDAVASICYFIWHRATDDSDSLLAVVDYDCPDWFEPVKRRLALNDLCWLDWDRRVNDIDDFDPWSRLVLLTHYECAGVMIDGKSHYPSPIFGPRLRGVPQGVVRTPTLEHRKVEFPGYAHGDGLAASPGFCNEIGGLWPIAPCGRSSL